MRKTPSSPLLDVLAGYQGAECDTRRCGNRALLAVQRLEGQHRVVDQRADQGLPGLPVVPIARELAGGGVVIITQEDCPHPGGHKTTHLVTRGQHLADGARSSVTVSSVATASKMGVKSSTRARYFMPRSP